jgi:YggT family protein
VSPIAAIDRDDAALFVDNVFLVFIIMIFASIAISWVVSFRGSLPYNRPLRAVTGFLDETVTPYLNVFRRFLPTVGVGGMGLDLSPIVALVALFIVRAIVVGLISG